MLALADVLQELLDFLFGIVTRDLLNYCFPFQSVGQRGPNEQRGQVDSDHVSQSADFLCTNPQISPKMSRSDAQRGDQIAVRVHHAGIILTSSRKAHFNRIPT